VPVEPDNAVLDQLIEAAYRQTLARFETEVRDGTRNALTELATYRQQRRDYVSLLRMESVPDEAHALAERLLQTHNLVLPAAMQKTFEMNVTRLLIRLYDDFIAAAGGSHDSR